MVPNYLLMQCTVKNTNSSNSRKDMKLNLHDILPAVEIFNPGVFLATILQHTLDPRYGVSTRGGSGVVSTGQILSVREIQAG